MPLRDLHERTRVFAINVTAFCRTLPKTDEAREAAGQLRRAANAVRANYRAARRGRSRAEFEAKLGTVFEEARELASIFARSVSTARANTRAFKSSKSGTPRKSER